MSSNKKDKKNKLSISFTPGDKEKLVREDDEEFEREAAERYRAEIDADEEAIRNAEKLREQQKRDYEQRLRQEKIAMIRAKQGIEEEEISEEPDEEQEPAAPMSFWKKVENFWYHYKWATIISVVVLAFGGYMIYDLITKVNPDIMIIVTADNGLSYRAESVQTLFEKYAEDLNGDGVVNVEVAFVPMNPNGGADQYTQSNETKLYANLSSAQCVLYLTDDDSSFAFEQVLFDDLTKELDSKYVTSEGVSLSSAMIREGFNWAQMPEDMVLRLRTPMQTLAASTQDMQEKHDEAMRLIEKLVAAMDEYDGAH